MPPQLPHYRAKRLPGIFRIVGRSGVPPMIAALLQNGRVVFADKVENYTEITLENGRYAYSAEYDPITGSLIPLRYKVCILNCPSPHTELNSCFRQTLSVAAELYWLMGAYYPSAETAR